MNHKDFYYTSILAAIPLIATSAPSNFLWLKRNGSAAFTIVSACAVFVPPMVWGFVPLDREIAITITFCVLNCFSIIACIAFQQAYNIRYSLWCKVKGIKEDRRRAAYDTVRYEAYYRAKHAEMLKRYGLTGKHKEYEDEP